MRWFKKNKSLQTADQLKLEHAQFEIDPWAYNRTLKEAADARRILAEEEEIRLKPIMDKAKAEQKRLALIEKERNDRYEKIHQEDISKRQAEKMMREGTASMRERSGMSRADKEIESRPEFVQMWAVINLMSSQRDHYKEFQKSSETDAWLETRFAQVGNLDQIIDDIQFTIEKRCEHYALRLRQEQIKQGR